MKRRVEAVEPRLDSASDERGRADKVERRVQLACRPPRRARRRHVHESRRRRRARRIVRLAVQHPLLPERSRGKLLKGTHTHIVRHVVCAAPAEVAMRAHRGSELAESCAPALPLANGRTLALQPIWDGRVPQQTVGAALPSGTALLVECWALAYRDAQAAVVAAAIAAIAAAVAAAAIAAIAGPMAAAAGHVAAFPAGKS
eukprot:5344485-Pleurochrysis_carterae.AAC.7